MGDRGDQRVLGGEDHEGRPEQRVGPRREDAQDVAARLVVVRRDREVDLGAFGPADPVGLHVPDRVGPVQAGEVEQLVRVLRRAQVPLVQVALLDQRAAPPAVPVDAFDLLARERPVVRAPVDRRLHAIGQALLQEAQEQPLVPAIELRVGRDDLGIPREGRAHRPELPAHLLDVRHRPGERVAAVLDGGVLGGQAEGIEADRKEHVVAVHPAIARQGVRRGDDVPVADVQVARRIRVHREQVVLGLRLVAKVRVVQAVGRPLRLPLAPRWRTDRSVRSGFGPRRYRSRWPSDTTHPPPAGEGWMVGCARVDGGATGTRTPDPLHAMQVLFQLSYSPTERAFYQRGLTGRSWARQSSVETPP